MPSYILEQFKKKIWQKKKQQDRMSKARVSSDKTTVEKITAIGINKLRQAMKCRISSCFKSSHKHGVSGAVGKSIAPWKNLCCHTVRQYSILSHPEARLPEEGGRTGDKGPPAFMSSARYIHRDCESPHTYTVTAALHSFLEIK